MLAGLPKFGRISKLPYPTSVKTHFVCNGVFSGCFYGCEASYVNESVCAKVASAVSSCLAPKAARRSKHMLFSRLDRECDPFAFVLSKRVSMLRRMLVMYPWLGEPVATILQNYLNRGFPGAALAPGEAASHVAPSMEVPGSSEAKAKHFSMGPIGHLLFSLSQYDMALGQDLNVIQEREVPFNLLEAPFQYLKPLIRSAVLRKRSRWVAAERSVCSNVGEIDFFTLNDSLRRDKGSKFMQSLWHATLASWSDSLLEAIDYAPSAACRCGHHDCTFHHAVWDCPLTQHLRDKHALLNLVDHSRFSRSLAAGVPSMLSADINTCPWDPTTPWTSNDFENFARAAGYQSRELMLNYHEGTTYSNLMEDSTLHGLSARRLVAKMRGPFGAAFPDPPPHYLPGNEDEDFVKVWTDGNVYFP